MTRMRIAAWVALAGLIAGCGGYGRGKGEGSGNDGALRDGRNGPGVISERDTNAGVSGTGRGDTATPTAGPRQSSDVSEQTHRP